MSEEQLKAFIEKVNNDTSLQEKLKAEGADSVAIANEAGFVISVDDLKKAQSAVDDDELQGASGGGSGALLQLIAIALNTPKNPTN